MRRKITEDPSGGGGVFGQRVKGGAVAKRAERGLRAYQLPLLTLGAGLLLAAALTHLVYRYENDRLRHSAERRLTDIAFQIGSRVDRINVVLQVSRSFLESRSGNAITRDRFVRYHRHLQDAGMLEGMQGLGFAALLPQGDSAATEARIAEDYGLTRRLWPAPAAGRLHSAITLLEPPNARNLAALGFDMMSEDIRRAAMEAAMVTDQPQLTGPVTLVQEITDERQTGALIYLYLKSDMNNELPGFLYAPLRLGSLFETVLQGRYDGYALRIADAEEPQIPLYETEGYNETPDLRGAAFRRLEAAGRVWELSLRDPRMNSSWRSLPMTFVVGGLALISAMLAAAATHSLQAYLRNARELAKVQRRILAQKDLHLREMSHRLKNVLARVSAIARQTANRSEDRSSFLRSFNGRLQAMAAAQDLLTRAAPEGTSLRGLLMAELNQLYGDSPSNVSVEGSDIHLTSEQTEALGLCIHEMATNALKYGAGTLPGGQIAIRWDLDGTSLHLIWDEVTAAPVAPPEKPGFGTRLMDSCVQGTLNGHIGREFHTHGLTIRISFPLQRIS
ncbi:CHASE domain-containing protein [Falsigemmobacter faecalis]|uniref:CHASE domain-containing protein n=1 Tax=Falsigemmobacter faecalis TaxID=2488730 RepID=UPI0013154BA0|nr:CHASE domain-containing protein [Falsigemmobacter faecalis]